MSATILHCEQRSLEWAGARLGRLCGSHASKIWSGWDVKEGRKKGSESAMRRELRRAMCCERITGLVPEDEFKLPAHMQRGVDKEQDAFDAYELLTGRAVRRVGFVSRDDLLIGCSPDGIVGDLEGGVELKCPNSTTHIEYIQEAEGRIAFKGIPEDYIPQIRHNLYVTQAQWWDFVSFDDRLPDGLRLFVRRLHYAEAGLPAYDEETRKFLIEVDRECAALRALIVVPETEAA